MELQDTLANVRLKFFLARQAEARGTGMNAGMHVADRPAGILAALALMERYSSTQLNGEQIRSLFSGLSASGLSNVIHSLNSKSLVEKNGAYYRVTAQGIIFLTQFADEVLGTPKSVEAELRQNSSYRELMTSVEALIDKDLHQKFETAIRKRRARGRPRIAARVGAINGTNCCMPERVAQ